MKVIVTGSRDWDDLDKLRRVLDALLVLNGPKQEFQVIHGGARGADTGTRTWVGYQAQVLDLPVTEKVYPVINETWRSSRAAGLHRNTRMVAENRDADLVVAFSRAGSRGTAHCVSEALQWELPVWFIDYDLEPPRAPNPAPPWWPAKGI
jgi:hypothetical protein